MSLADGGKLELKENHTFTVTDVDSVIFGASDHTKRSGAGTWNLITPIGGHNLTQVELGFDFGFVTSLGTQAGKKPLRLLYYIGDPDSNDVYAFEKVAG